MPSLGPVVRPREAPLARLEFFFNCGSAWTDLAFHTIEEVATEAGAKLSWLL